MARVLKARISLPGYEMDPGKSPQQIRVAKRLVRELRR
jgi:hypothetical protein